MSVTDQFRHRDRNGKKMLDKIKIIYSWFLAIGRRPVLIRYFVPLIVSLAFRKNTPARLSDVPWITFDCTRWLDKRLSNDLKVFEYGSGGSTLYFSKKTGQVVSVEHDDKWFARVAEALKQNNIDNCDQRLVKPVLRENVREDLADDPDNYLSSSPDYAAYDFENYCRSIDQFPDRSFDIIFIDGRARPSCIKHSLRKVKSGGCMILDNSEREHYQKGIKLMDGWQRTDFYGPSPNNLLFSQTSVFCAS
jgi:hypothetical protein